MKKLIIAGQEFDSRLFLGTANSIQTPPWKKLSWHQDAKW